MMMSELEIASEYRQAKTPLKQIGILAELNGCERQEIVEILRAQGCELPKQYQDKREKDTSSGAGAPPSNQGEGNASQGSGSDAGALRKLKRFLQAVIVLEELLEGSNG